MRRDVIRALCDEYHDKRVGIVRGELNRVAVERFYQECSRTPAMRAYIFREKRP